ETARDPVWGQVDLDPERFEHVRAADAAGLGAVAVLGNRHTGTRDDQRDGGRHVEEIRPVAAGPARVYEYSRRRHLQHVGAHGSRRAHELVDGFAFDAQGGEQRADLRGRGTTRHDRVHDGTHGRLVEVLPGDNTRDGVAQETRAGVDRRGGGHARLLRRPAG